MRLSELNTGQKGVIVKVLGHGGFRKRIVEMGFIKGKTVEVLLNAPLKDPIKYKVMGYEISLRRQEAEMIEIISEEEAKTLFRNEESPQGLHEDIPLDDETLKRMALGKRRTINVALVGNPNCGKTSLFNIASGSHEHVGNYSGVTVDAKEGFFDFQGYHFRLVDLPGTYSLSAYSPEELYVRRHIIDETPDIIINVVDSSNLERNLYLTTQLIDMNVRMVVALNMYDELEASGNTLDYLALSQLLGVPMVPTVRRTGKGGLPLPAGAAAADGQPVKPLLKLPLDPQGHDHRPIFLFVRLLGADDKFVLHNSLPSIDTSIIVVSNGYLYNIFL